MDQYEIPRIGNRSDALDLLEKIAEEIHEKGLLLLAAEIEVLKNAIEREIL